VPDPIAVAEQLSPAALSGFMRPRFVERRRVVRVNHALPLPPAALLVLVLALGAAVAALARRRILRPLDMRRIRYVARLRPGWLYGMALAGSALLAAALLLRLAAYGAERLTTGVLWRVDSLVVQWSAYAAMLTLLVWGGVTALSYVPRKLLVLDDEITVKFLAYRSRPIAPDDVAELALLRFADVWLTRRLWRCVPLTLGVLRPGVYLRTRRGRAWYFATRDPRVTYEVLSARTAGVS
jgi:hypothetical protein